MHKTVHLNGFTFLVLDLLMSLMGSGTVKIVKQNCTLCVHHACIFTTLNPTHAVVLEVVEQDQHFACIANLYTNGFCVGTYTYY